MTYIISAQDLDPDRVKRMIEYSWTVGCVRYVAWCWHIHEQLGKSKNRKVEKHDVEPLVTCLEMIVQLLTRISRLDIETEEAEEEEEEEDFESRPVSIQRLRESHEMIHPRELKRQFLRHWPATKCPSSMKETTLDLNPPQSLIIIHEHQSFCLVLQIVLIELLSKDKDLNLNLATRVESLYPASLWTTQTSLDTRTIIGKHPDTEELERQQDRQASRYEWCCLAIRVYPEIVQKLIPAFGLLRGKTCLNMGLNMLNMLNMNI